MTILDLQNKLVAVLGFGLEGKATVKYLIKHGVKPVLFDERPLEKFSNQDKEFINSLKINFVFGEQAFKELRGYDVVFRSPGIILNKLDAENLHCQITSQTKFFFDNCPAKIIGVTGTKGKGTTSTLIYKILEANTGKLKGKNYLTGNIGKIQPFEIIDDLTSTDLVVYELSSFQLQDLNKSPHISVVLMTTSEHLDYHKTQKDYIDAKTSIAKYQTQIDFTIINYDYPSSSKIGSGGEGNKIFFSNKSELNQGIYLKDGLIIINNVVGNYGKLPISNFQLRGNHNLENICAAIGASLCAGAKIDTLLPNVENFKGLEHRLEFVREFKGVKYYNDSFSTTPETAIAAIKSFNEPLTVILGGSSKNSDFKNLGQEIIRSPNVKSVVLIGQEEKRLLNALKGFTGTIFRGQKSLEEIFEALKGSLNPGEVLLLSPACASFDMFKNYEDRGIRFKKIVNSLS